MRILFVAPRFHTNQYQVVKTLLDKNHRVFFHVATLGPTEDHSLLTPVNFKQSKISIAIEKYFGTGGVNKPRYFPAILSYWSNLCKLQPDIVIIRDPYNSLFAIVAAFCSLFTGAKIVFYSQEELYRTRKVTTILKQSLTIALFRAAWMTPILGNKNGKNYSIKNMYYVPIPIQCRATQQNPERVLEEVPRLLMIGKYHQERKKHLLLVEAINRLKPNYNLKATFVGECVTPAQIERHNMIAATIQKLGLTDTITLLKNVPYNEMGELYSSHHIFVLPAVNEQYGVSTTEALGYGLPAICTDTCGARYNIKHGENGFIVKSGSVDALTAVLEKLISDKQNIARMCRNSIEYAHHHLSGEAFYSNFAQLLNKRFKIQNLN